MTLHSVMSVMHCALRRPLRAQTMALRWNSVGSKQLRPYVLQKPMGDRNRNCEVRVLLGTFPHPPKKYDNIKSLK